MWSSILHLALYVSWEVRKSRRQLIQLLLLSSQSKTKSMNHWQICKIVLCTSSWHDHGACCYAAFETNVGLVKLNHLQINNHIGSRNMRMESFWSWNSGGSTSNIRHNMAKIQVKYIQKFEFKFFKWFLVNLSNSRQFQWKTDPCSTKKEVIRIKLKLLQLIWKSHNFFF